MIEKILDDYKAAIKTRDEAVAALLAKHRAVAKREQLGWFSISLVLLALLITFIVMYATK